MDLFFANKSVINVNQVQVYTKCVIFKRYL